MGEGVGGEGGGEAFCDGASNANEENPEAFI